MFSNVTFVSYEKLVNNTISCDVSKIRSERKKEFLSFIRIE